MKANRLMVYVAKETDDVNDRLCHAINWVINRKNENRKTNSILKEL